MESFFASLSSLLDVTSFIQTTTAFTWSCRLHVAEALQICKCAVVSVEGNIER
jgi:hypothetical protein